MAINPVQAIKNGLKFLGVGDKTAEGAKVGLGTSNKNTVKVSGDVIGDWTPGKNIDVKVNDTIKITGADGKPTQSTLWSPGKQGALERQNLANQGSSPEYMAYRKEQSAAIKAERGESPAPRTQQAAQQTEKTVAQQLNDQTVSPGKQGIKSQSEEAAKLSKSLRNGAIITLATAGVGAGLVGIPQLLSNIPGADGNNEGGNQGGNDQGGLWEIIRSLFGGSQTPGGTYYLGGGNDPGEPDSSETSIVNEAAEAVSQSLPYILIGVGILVIILAITKNGKKSGKPSAAKKTAKKGGSHA